VDQEHVGAITRKASRETQLERETVLAKVNVPGRDLAQDHDI
jgi:hypothetical protein